jgi:hypothetical protein
MFFVKYRNESSLGERGQAGRRVSLAELKGPDTSSVTRPAGALNVQYVLDKSVSCYVRVPW